MKSHMRETNHPTCSQYAMTCKADQLSSDVIEMERTLHKPLFIHIPVDNNNDFIAVCPLCSMIFSNKFTASWHYRVVHDQTCGRYALSKITLREVVVIQKGNTCQCGEEFRLGRLLHKHWAQKPRCYPFPPIPKKSIVLCECLLCHNRGFKVSDNYDSTCGLFTTMRQHCCSHKFGGELRMKIMLANDADKRVLTIEPFNTPAVDPLSLLCDMGRQCLKETAVYKFVGKNHVAKIKEELKLLTSLVKK